MVVVVVVVVDVVVVCLYAKPFFLPTTSAVPAVSFLIHPREIQIMWSQTVRQRKTKRYKESR